MKTQMCLTPERSRRWRSAVGILMLLASLIAAGCVTRHGQTGDRAAVTSAESLPLAERVTFYAVPFR